MPPRFSPQLPRLPSWRHSSDTEILVVAYSFVLLLAVTSADVLLKNFSVLLFYLVPIAWCAWLGGRWTSVAVAGFSAAARFGVLLVKDRGHEYTRPEMVWEVTWEFVFFLVFSWMLFRVHQAWDEERDLARSDPLTGLRNARAFAESLVSERERLYRYGRILTLVYLDLDNFKQVNDRLGHHTGDRLLREVGKTLRNNTRGADAVARLGGDEFALLMPETDEAGAALALNRVRSRLLEAMTNENWPVTCSIGAVTFRVAPASIEEMLQAADAQMYRSKTSGKNQIHAVIYDAAAAKAAAESGRGPAVEAGTETNADGDKFVSPK